MKMPHSSYLHTCEDIDTLQERIRTLEAELAKTHLDLDSVTSNLMLAEDEIAALKADLTAWEKHAREAHACTGWLHVPSLAARETPVKPAKRRSMRPLSECEHGEKIGGCRICDPVPAKGKEE